MDGEKDEGGDKVNELIMTGRLTKDVELKYTPAQKPYCNFCIAVEKRGRTDGANFFNCTAFGKTAEAISTYLGKGRKILIVGSLDNDEYTKRDGTKEKTCKILVSTFEFIDKKEQATGNVTEPEFMAIPENVAEGLPFV